MNPTMLAHQQEREILSSQVRPILTEELGVDPDAVYFNAVDSLESLVVLDSATLTQLTVQAILDKDDPTFTDWGGSGFFSVAYSFADEHRIPNAPTHEKLTEVVNKLVGQLG